MDHLTIAPHKLEGKVTTWENLVAKAVQTKEIRYKAGEYLGKNPCGYKRQGKGIVPNIHCAEVVKIAFTLADSGHTLSQILIQINTPAFIEAWGRPLQKSSIHMILTNPLYCGLIRANGTLHQGSHIPLVSPETFCRVQQKLSGRHR